MNARPGPRRPGPVKDPRGQADKKGNGKRPIA